LLELLLELLLDVSEHVVENKISGWLLGENECLNKFLWLSILVGCLSDNLDNDVLVGSLGVDIRNANLAVLEIQSLDALLNGLNMLA